MESMAQTPAILYQPNDATLNPFVSPPIIASSGITFSNIQKDQMTLSWTNGNGASRLLLAKAVSAVDGTVLNGQAYSANSVFGSGTQVGTGNFAVYNGTGTSVTLTGLTANTIYHFKLIEFNGIVGSESYGSSAVANKITTTVSTIALAATLPMQTGFTAN